MRRLSFIVPAEMEGRKLKSFLRGPCGLSARLMIRLKYVPMGIARNGEHARVIDLIHAGDRIDLSIPEDSAFLDPVSVPLDVVFEDDDLLVVNKPAGMPVHPSPGHDTDTLANAAAAYFQQEGLFCAFRAVCRLDKDTTGLMVLAKNPYAAARLSGAVRKGYTAVCEGLLQGSGVIDAPIRNKEGYGIRREVGEGGDPAVTHWRAVAWSGGHTVLRLWLETGRTHQIRVHMESIGHPLAGDDMYGGGLSRIGRQALHCGYASFVHPVTGQRLQLSAPVPEDMCALFPKDFQDDEPFNWGGF